VGFDRGGIAGLAATLRDNWDAVEADFTRYYQTDLGGAVRSWSLRKLLGHVKHLPPSAALWREQGLRDPLEVFHEWMVTLIQFQAGKKVTTPSLWRGDALPESAEPESDGEVRKVEVGRANPDELRAVLGNAGIVVS
jgi:hypothetical protein